VESPGIAWSRTVIASLWRKWVRNVGRNPRTILRLEHVEDRLAPAGLAAIGSQPGTPALVTVFDAETKAQQYTISPFPGFTGGVNVAVGDVNGDGTMDVIVGAGLGGGPIVNVYDGTNGSFLKTFVSGDPASRAGVSVAAGDIDQDGLADIITGSMNAGQPYVQAVRFADLSAIRVLTPFSGAAGVTVASGDVNGDGTPDIIAGSGPNVASAVAVFSGTDGSILRSFNPFESTFLGGVYVAAGDVNADSKADVIVAASTLGGPRVSVFSGLNGLVTANFFAYDSNLRDGALAVAYNANATGNLDLATTNGPNNTPDPKAFDAATTAQISATLLPGLPITTAYDTKAPTPTLSTTATNPTAGTPIPFTATFSEAVNGFATAGITVTNGTAGAVTRVNARTWTFNVTPTADGAVSVTVNANAAFDAAGNKNTASTASSVTFDSTPPTVTANNVTTNDTTPTLTGTVNESTAIVSVSVDGQTITATVSGTNWTATVPTALDEGSYTVTVTATDTLGNDATATASLAIDTSPPTPTVSTSSPSPTNTAPIPFQIEFVEDVTGFVQGDITVTNGTIASFTAVDGSTYNITVTPSGDLPVSVSVAAGRANDIAGNANPVSNTVTVNFDGTAPAVTANNLLTRFTTPTLTGTVNDSTATVSVTVDGQTFNATVTGATWSATVPAALDEGTYPVSVTATDPVGNDTTATATLTVDTTAPVVSSITAVPSTGTFGVGETIDISVTLSEAATLSGGTFQLLLDTGATVDLTQDSGNPAQYVGTYTVASGDTSSDLDSVSLSLLGGATLVDAAGNDANLAITPAATLADDAEIVIDTTV
jgi:hypothetical protein